MNFRNKTEEKVLGQLIGSRQWGKLAPRYPFPFTLKQCSPHVYAIYLDTGIHTGTFINAFFVDPAECKELGWKIIGVIRDVVDPTVYQDEIKLKTRRPRKKKEKK